MLLTAIVAWPSVMRVHLENEPALRTGSAGLQAPVISAAEALRCRFHPSGTEETG